MGAGQIGGIATILDIDFENAAGFIGRTAMPTEGQFMVYYFSHALMFCVGALIEAHIVLTPAMCVYGERYMFEVFGGAHFFLENSGVPRKAQHLAIHRGYNHSRRWVDCVPDNIAILVLDEQFSFNKREYGSDFIVNRVRYGVVDKAQHSARANREKAMMCEFFGWGSRRNGYLIPLLIHMQRVEAKLLAKDVCPVMWNKDNKYLCVEHPPCKSEDFGALCPDDVGTALVCQGYIKGMMISKLVDRPCGVGFLDITLYNKFITCAVDDSRDVITTHFMSVQLLTTLKTPNTPSVIVAPHIKPKMAVYEEYEGTQNQKVVSAEKKPEDDDEEYAKYDGYYKDELRHNDDILQDQLRQLKGLLDEEKSIPRKGPHKRSKSKSRH